MGEEGHDALMTHGMQEGASVHGMRSRILNTLQSHEAQNKGLLRLSGTGERLRERLREREPERARAGLAPRSTAPAAATASRSCCGQSS